MRERVLLKAERVEARGAGARTGGSEAPRDATPPEWLLRSPVVGRVVTLAPRGAQLEAGAVAAVVRILRREVDLVIPEGSAGAVVERLPGVAGDARHPAVGWGDVLLRLGVGIALAGDGPHGRGSERGDPSRSTADAGDDVPAGHLAIRSPTDGLFYRRPSPDLPPYVEEGAAIERGAVLGLVEVMKCFNQIIYGAGGQEPASATVARILAADGSEVRSGQVLMVVKASTIR